METESEFVNLLVEIPGTVKDKFDSVAKEWRSCMTGDETIKRHASVRRMEKVPKCLLQTKKGRRNSECYEPAVVSLGPYHHNKLVLAQAENYKLVTLQEFCLSTRKAIDELYHEVFKVVHDARKCYIDGSTDAYSDREFCQMMLRDGCFIVFFMEGMTYGESKLMLTNEYLGTTEILNIPGDIFLLENQIPFLVLQVLLQLKSPKDKGEGILNGFFNYLNRGVALTTLRKKVLQDKQQPLHLLELYRSYFISPYPATKDADYNYVKRNRYFASATELKNKWIFLDQATEDNMTFRRRGLYGEFKITRRAVSTYTKAIYLNMIAYEMCPHNPNDFRVSSYVRVMKSLIMQESDVKELRDRKILVHGLGRDEDVVKIFDEIEVPAVNLYMYNELRQQIGKLHKTKFKTWLRELIVDYFSSPWKALGLLFGFAVIIASFVQTYFTINPPKGH
ncbi:hypothetical protein L1987_41227 [Smallanthus sonchifolius]|uniref:Uncharacterized protein n=1 Tax=Smallanthus sonchifolius TaxID=185202 RepID=A0ACB9GUJ2_9ASTR|nr:hypothetical protein L1987_41227 [Smallanthus sonchifolius]